MRQQSASYYYKIGFELIFTTGLKRFVFIPLIVNLVIFAGAFYALYIQLESLMTSVEAWVPESLTWITNVLLPLMLLGVLMGFSYIFSTATNWLAAPFNGLLAEKVEEHIRGKNHHLAAGGTGAMIKDIPRSLAREWKKLKYYLPRAIGFIILSIIIPVVGPIIWFLFTAWMMAIQYCDYAFDNHRIDFDEMKYSLRQQKGLVFSFGGLTTVLAMIPFVNLALMPVAICAATAMSLENFAELDE